MAIPEDTKSAIHSGDHKTSKAQMMNFSFGWGLIIAALLFGSMHVLSPGNPFHPAWGLWTFVGGIGEGIIREMGDSFLASALVHGTIMIFPVFFGM